MMLTGRYGQRYGYECNLDKPGDGLPDDEELLPALLKRYDYRNGCIGKWHLGSEPSQRPNAKGFDTFYGLLAGHRSYFYDPETSDGGWQPVTIPVQRAETAFRRLLHR